MEQVWIGKNEVSPGATCLFEFAGEFAGAFAWWATQSKSASHFRTKVERAIFPYGLVLLELTEAKLAEAAVNLSKELAEISESNADWVLYGTFHKYKHHGA